MDAINLIEISQNIFVTLFIIIGISFCSIGMLGLFRFSDIYSKQHAAGLIDTAGIFFICLGLTIYSGLHLVSLKPILLSILIALISTPSCYAFMQILIKRKSDKTIENIKNNGDSK